MKICVFNARPPYTTLEQVLIGTRFVGLAVFLTELIALPIITRILGSYGILNFFVILQILKKAVQKIDRPLGVVRLGRGHRSDTGGRCDRIVVVRKLVPCFADLKNSLLHVHVLPA